MQPLTTPVIAGMPSPVPQEMLRSLESHCRSLNPVESGLLVSWRSSPVALDVSDRRRVQTSDREISQAQIPFRRRWSRGPLTETGEIASVHAGFHAL